jgi:anti-sigma-K factor RskA
MNENAHEYDRDELAAYALGALDADEASALERHLEGCAKCREELEWLRPAVNVLQESVERVAPPVELRGRLMQQVRAEAAGARSSGHLATPHQRSWRLRPLAGLAALALIVAGVAAYAISDSDGGGEGATTVVTGHSPSVTAEMVRNGETGTLHLANVHQLPRDKVLQAWVQRGKRVESAKALFVPNPDGTASATIDDMDGVDTVMVTAEPRGGSVKPTSAPIISVSIPN